MFKNIFLSLFATALLLPISIDAAIFSPTADTVIQNFHRQDKVVATKTEGLIRLQLMDFRQQPLSAIPIFIHNGNGQFWQGTSDNKGEVFFLLPNQSNYLVNVQEQVDYRKFSIPKEKNYFKTVKVVLMSIAIKEWASNDTIFQQVPAGLMPSASRALINIKIRDLNDQPLAGEALYFNATNSKKIYIAKTNDMGKAQLLLPKGEEYCIHSYAFRDITCKQYEQNEHSRTSKFELNMISTAEFKQRAAERKQLLARRDSIQHLRRIQDSIQLARNEYQNFYLQHRYQQGDYATIEAKIKTVAALDKKEVSLNNNYYANAGEEIRAMLDRNKKNWKQKRIVANIDCSMYNYIDELMVWNYSDPEEQKNNQYWLFNGFNYEDPAAADHSRRGIFPVVENNVEGFFKTIDKIVNFSCRGSRLENVVEALILGARNKASQEDLLFIADNYSDVSDLEKLNELRVPVHVLLTAAEQGVNENYLEIAYHTGGTIHTLLEDISKERLQALKDGELLSIGRFKYQFFKGRFLKV